MADHHQAVAISEDYHDLRQRLLALVAGEDDIIAVMATLACEIFHFSPRFHWVGFYRHVSLSLLKIGPYQGGHGCLVIPFDRGVCGACARSRLVQHVPDVHQFADHIACSSSTNSELVVPIINAKGDLLAVFDIDSDAFDAFTAEDIREIPAILGEVFANFPLIQQG